MSSPRPRSELGTRALASLATILLLCTVGCGGAPSTPRHAPRASRGVQWQDWSAEAFARAAREQKLILVSVQAGWCHWCHVMNATTLRDPEVLRLLDETFVSVRVEADARPDLAERYAEWGWPATILLTSDARPIMELRGYRAPEVFRRILDELVTDLRAGRPIGRRPEPPAAPDPALADVDALRSFVTAQLDAMYDEAQEGWGTPQKYPYAAPVEHAFYRARLRGESTWRDRALRTLEAHAALIDPVWGGMYQYSVGGAWQSPHYEKIIPVQTGAIDNFAEAYRATGDEVWLRRARDVARYLTGMMRSEDGTFYTSQDADYGSHGPPEEIVHGPDYYRLDDAARRAIGIPHIDTSIYANTNGMVIAALTKLYEATLDEALLADAERAAAAILTTHARGDGFAHAAGDPGPMLHLADQAEMANALLTLHDATGNADYLERAKRTVRLVMRELLDLEHGGYFAHTPDPEAAGIFAERRKPLEENATIARVMLRLHHLDGDAAWRDAATAALRSLANRRGIARLGRKVGEYLLALEALSAPHVIFSVVGPRDRPETAALYRAALHFYEPTRVMELGRPGASRYPYPDEPAIFLCTEDSCSMPVTDPADFAQRAGEFLRRPSVDPSPAGPRT